MRTPLFRFPGEPDRFEIQLPRVPVFYEHPFQRNLSFAVWAGLLALSLGVLLVLGNRATAGQLLGQPTWSLLRKQWWATALAGVSMATLFRQGGFDWSFASVLTLAGVITALPVPYPVPLAITSALVVGTVNGALVGTLRYPGLLVTLATSLLLQGVALALLRNPVMVNPLQELTWMYVAGITLVLMVIVSTIWVQFPIRFRKKAISGRGSSRVRMALALGLPYVYSSFSACIAGFYFAARLQAAPRVVSPQWLFDGLLIVLLGGTVFAGGYANVIGALLASCLVVCLHFLANLLGLETGTQLALQGVLLILALFVNHLYHVLFGFFCRSRPHSRA
jgi:ribose transport system permease protein